MTEHTTVEAILEPAVDRARTWLSASAGGDGSSATERLADLVREVEGEPAALPMLSHVLRETWERREGPTLTVDGYRATGGIRDAVSRSAESLYDAMDDSQRSRLRGLLLRLVMPTEDGDPVRAAQPRGSSLGGRRRRTGRERPGPARRGRRPPRRRGARRARRGTGRSRGRRSAGGRSGGWRRTARGRAGSGRRRSAPCAGRTR